MAPSRNKESIANTHSTTFLQQRSLTPTHCLQLCSCSVHTYYNGYTQFETRLHPTFSVCAPQYGAAPTNLFSYFPLMHAVLVGSSVRVSSRFLSF